MKTFLLFCVFLATDFAGHQVKVMSADTASVKDVCIDDRLGITFYCRAEWQMQEAEDAVLMILSETPDVTAIIARIDTSIVFLEQLTDTALKEKERYAEGFRTERVLVNGRKAVMVKAFARNDPSKRLLDYYFIHQSSLYGLLFSVSPKEAADDYKFVFKQITDQLTFIN